ncbi:MAG TPA: c-type cytochrome [Usitatibacter sp.]|nr:c-type cytochrome [Usitatibacter sp.]
MKTRNIALALAVSSLFLAAGVRAESGAELLKSKGCTNCHDAEKKKVGPSIKDIAAKNAGKADALTTKVASAKGHPKVKATDDEVKSAVTEMLKAK